MRMICMLSLFIAGCGSGGSTKGPLVGTWTTTQSGVTYTISFHDSGEVTGSESVDGCTGALEYEGGTWTADSTTITLHSATEACTGTITCSSFTATCGMTSSGMGTCDWAIPPSNDTLALTCFDDAGPSTMTFERVN